MFDGNSVYGLKVMAVLMCLSVAVKRKVVVYYLFKTSVLPSTGTFATVGPGEAGRSVLHLHKAIKTSNTLQFPAFFLLPFIITVNVPLFIIINSYCRKRREQQRNLGMMLTTPTLELKIFVVAKSSHHHSRQRKRNTVEHIYLVYIGAQPNGT